MKTRHLLMISSFFGLAFLLTACTPQQIETVMGEKEDMEVKDDGVMIEEEKEDSVMQNHGNLFDVTKGLDVRGVNTSGKAFGDGSAVTENGKYDLSVTFGNLPEPIADDFYEGWVVRKDPLSVVSTGKVSKVDGQYKNIFNSDQDLSKYSFYVLTLEPNDGDPAPADHIVEGDIEVNVIAAKDNKPFTYSGQKIAGKNSVLIDFNKTDYDNALSSGKTVFLYFYANWCPVCEREMPHIKGAFDELKSDEVIGFRVNFNDSDTGRDEKKLAQQFGVIYQHTKVAIQDGQGETIGFESWPIDRYLEEINKLISN